MNKLKDLTKYSLDEKYPEYGLFPDSKGNWITFDDIEKLSNNIIVLNSDQQKALMKLGLELIELNGKHKNFNNAKAISLIVEIVENHKFKEE